VKQGRCPPWHRVAAPAKFSASRPRGRWGNGSRRRPARGGARFRGWSGEKTHRPTLSTVVASRRWSPVVVVRTRGRGAWRLGRGVAWRCLIAWGGALGGGQQLEAWFDSEVLLAEAAASRVLWALLARRLEDGHRVGESKQGSSHSPGACSPQLLIDGCTMLHGAAWRVERRAASHGAQQREEESKTTLASTTRGYGRLEAVGGARGRWSPMVHSHYPWCCAGDRCTRLSGC
jgi:hypothetical protein